MDNMYEFQLNNNIKNTMKLFVNDTKNKPIIIVKTEAVNAVRNQIFGAHINSESDIIFIKRKIEDLEEMLNAAQEYDYLGKAKGIALVNMENLSDIEKAVKLKKHNMNKLSIFLIIKCDETAEQIKQTLSKQTIPDDSYVIYEITDTEQNTSKLIF